MFFTAKAYLTYLLKGKTKYYIHSPFVFSFINAILYDKRQFYFFEDIKNLRKELLQDSHVITIKDYGAGSNATPAAPRKLSSLVKTATIPEKYGQLVSRLVNYFQCITILELGTCVGISTAYLASSNTKARIITLEGDEQLIQLAEKNFDRLHLKNIECIGGNFSETLPMALGKLNTVDLAFIDGNHQYEPTIHYFRQLLNHINNDSILIFDDIHWSAEMQQAWRDICSHSNVTITIDLFRMGLVFFRKEQAKENFVLYF